jgi:NAD(P)-dependent dehydrogenase (short-subunit alcohol dehydrogenase family)
MTLPATLPGFPGRVAVVTGGSRGIGAAACRLLVAGGARVAVVGPDPVAVQDLVEELRWMGGVAIGVVADPSSDPSAVRELGEPSLFFTFGSSEAALGIFSVTIETSAAGVRVSCLTSDDGLDSPAADYLAVATLAVAGGNFHP